MHTAVVSPLTSEELKPERFRGAYLALAQRIAAVPVPRAVNVRWIHVYGVVGRACRDIVPYRDRLLKVGGGFEIGTLDELPQLADAFIYTCSCAPEPRSVKRRNDERKAAIALRRKLQLSIDVLRSSGSDVPDFRGKLSAESGFEDVAADLVRLSLLVEAAAARGTDTGALSQAERDGATAIALRLLALSNEREEDARAVLEAVACKRQAFELMYDAYNEVRAALGFVFRRQPGMLDRIMPALLSGTQPRVKQRRQQEGKTRAEPSAVDLGTSADWWDD